MYFWGYVAYAYNYVYDVTKNTVDTLDILLQWIFEWSLKRSKTISIMDIVLLALYRHQSVHEALQWDTLKPANAL